ncbi:MAG: ferredoxin--NADP reductase [Bacteroidia bacterium]|nr:ferredoxin--NADP reductase [Bacteroidia bacterium]
MSKYFHKLPIKEIIAETEDAYTLVFPKPEAEDFSYLPGQYLTLRVMIDGTEERRAYSLSSCPFTDEDLAISIKRVEQGKVSNYLADRLEEGAEVELMRPMGKFLIEPDITQSRHCIMIGAGSGITPLFSMIKGVLDQEPESKVSLWYGNRREDSVMFARQLSLLQERYRERLQIVHVLSRATEEWKGLRGRLDKDRVYKLLSNLFMEDDFRKEYYLCGPRGMMDAAIEAFDKHSVHPGFIHQEHFSAELPSDEELDALAAAENESLTVSDGEEEYEIVEQEVSVKLNGNTHKLIVKPSESVLSALLDQDIDAPYTCLAGICTTCLAKINKGLVAMDTTDGLTDQEMEEGYILTCQAHPLDDEVEIEFPE